MSALEIAGLNFRYEETSSTWILRNLDLHVDEGEIVCILGASGCGKTTLLNLIAGLAQPNAGTIRVGQQATDNENRARIGYIFQDDALFPWRTVEANLMLATQMSREAPSTSARTQMTGYLQAFHLSEDVLKKYPSQLSGGMRQRVSIIQSLMFSPELLLLDEPFSALDFYTKLRLENEFFQLVKEQRKAAILVTHDIEESIAMGDRVLIMSKQGEFSGQFEIKLEGGDNRSPESVRGTAAFAEQYNAIWSQLKAVIAD